MVINEEKTEFILSLDASVFPHNAYVCLQQTKLILSPFDPDDQGRPLLLSLHILQVLVSSVCHTLTTCVCEREVTSNLPAACDVLLRFKMLSAGNDQITRPRIPSASYTYTILILQTQSTRVNQLLFLLVISLPEPYAFSPPRASSLLFLIPDSCTGSRRKQENVKKIDNNLINSTIMVRGKSDKNQGKKLTANDVPEAYT